jgi:hypothetical protein
MLKLINVMPNVVLYTCMIGLSSSLKCLLVMCGIIALVYVSKGDDKTHLCVTTTAFFFNLALWHSRHLHTYSKISFITSGQKNLAAISRNVFFKPRCSGLEPVKGYCKDGNDPSGSIKCWEVLE